MAQMQQAKQPVESELDTEPDCLRLTCELQLQYRKHDKRCLDLSSILRRIRHC